MPEEYLNDETIFPLVFNNSVEGILVVNGKGEIIRANPSVLHMFGYELPEILGKPVEKLIPSRFHNHHIDHRENYQKKPEVRRMASDMNLVGQTKAGKEIPVEISLNYTDSPVGMLVTCFIVDISNRVQLQAELKFRRDMIQQYLNVTASLFLIINKDETIQLINQTGCDLLGLTKEEILGKNWFEEFIPEHQRLEIRTVFNQMMSGSVELNQTHENVIVDVNGTEHLIEWHNTLLKDEEGLPVATLSSGIDITERRATQKLRTNALMEGQEKERHRIGRELHDGLGQSLSAVSLSLNALEPELEKFTSRFRKIYEGLKDQLKESIEDVRSISHDLMPHMLQDYGLEKALDYLCDTVDQSTPVKITWHIEIKGDRLKDTVELAVYRIIQELINNTIRHAKAKTLDIQVNELEDKLVLGVADDGQGFDLAKVKNGLGFHNIRTRLTLFNGDIHIDTGNQQGTNVLIEIPI